MSQIDILRLQDAEGLDFSFLEQQPEKPAQTTQPQATQDAVPEAVPGAVHDAEPLDFSFLEQPANDAAIAAQNVTYANQFSRQEVLAAGRHAKSLGISLSEALHYADSAKKLSRQADIESLRTLSPRLVSALQGDAAYAAKDDMDAFNAMSRAFDDYSMSHDDMVVGPELRQYRPGFSERTVKRLEEGAQQVGDSLRNSVLSLIEGFAVSSRKDAESSVAMANAIDTDPMQAFVEGLAQRIRQKGEDMQQERSPRLAPADSAVQRYYENVVSMAPQVLSQVATSVYGGPLLSMAMMGAQITGQKYEELTQKGVDADKALYASALSAIGQAPLEQLGLEKAMAVFKTSGAWNTAKALFGSAITEGVTEFAQAYPDALATIWAETSQKGGTFAQGLQEFVDQFGQITLDGLYEGAVAAPYGLLFGGLGMAHNGKAPQGGNALPLPPQLAEVLTQEAAQVVHMNQRQDLGTALYQAAQAADAASLKQQDPEALREVVEELIPQQFAQAWIGTDDAHSLYQSAKESGEVENLLQVMGTDAPSLEQALQQGAPLPVSTAAVLAQASPANRQGIIDALRVSPEGPSGTEAKSFDPAARMESALADIRSNQQVRSDVQRHVTRLKHEMIAADHPKHVAEIYAAMNASQATTFHASYGVDPVQLLARRSFVRDFGDTQEGIAQVYQAAKKTIYSDDRSLKMTFEETGVDPSFDDRTQLRAYIESLHPRDVQRMKLEDEQAYIAVLKSIVRKFFPTESGLRFRKEGKVLDYTHFVGRDTLRNEFLGTLPRTLKDQDIQVEFTTPEGEAKAYLIAKYFDASTQKDIWDMLVVRDGELKTKIARSGRKGAGYTESQIFGAGKEASPSASTEGATENASTPSGDNEQNIQSQESGVNGTQPHTTGAGDTVSQPASTEGATENTSTPSGDNTENIEQINTAFYQDAGGSPAYPSPIAGDVPPALKNGVSDTHINPANGSVNTLYQPLNEGVDLDAPVQVVTVQPRFAGENPLVLRKRFPEDIRAHVLAAFKVGVVNEDAGKRVGMSSRDFREHFKFVVGENETAHLEAIAALPELMRTAKLVETHKDKKPSQGSQLRQVHRFISAMRVGRDDFAVMLTVKEFEDGAATLDMENPVKLYHHRVEKALSSSDADVSAVPATTYVERDEEQSPPRSPASTSTYKIKQLLQDVKDNDGNSFYQTDEQNTKRGKTVFTPDGRAEVRIFSQKDVSTIPHESMHIFLDDLMTIAKDDGSFALAEAERRIQSILADASPAVRQSVTECSAPLLQAPPEGRPQALRQAAVAVAQWAADAAMSAKTAAASVQAMKDAGQQTENTLSLPPWAELAAQATDFQREASHYSRVHTALKEAITHMQGLEKARTDLTTLQQWAQVPEDIHMNTASEHYVPFHEAVAQGFEQYLLEGVAPSTALRSVFSRIRQWMLTVYTSARDILGIPITDDVRVVFDRMLATDTQMRAHRQLQNTLKSEDAFLESGQISYEEWQDLQDLRNEAEIEVQATMDRATLRDRASRRRKFLQEAKAFVAEDPFWHMVANISSRRKDPANPDAPARGGINKEGVVRLIGAENTAELSRKRAGLINAKGEGMPLDLVAKEHGYENEDEFINMLHERLVVREESVKKLAEELADQSMQDEDAQAEATGVEAGGQAYANYLDKVDEVVLGMLARKGYRTAKEQQRFIYNSITPRSRIRQMAADALYFTPLRDISSERYHAMLGMALKDRQQALVKGDVMKALNAVERARTANEMISLSRTIIARRQELEAFAARLAQAKQGTFPTVYREAMRKVLRQYNLGNMRGAPEPEFSNASLGEIMRQTLGENVVDVLPSFAPWIVENRNPNTNQPLLRDEKAFDYRGLTPNQLQDVDNILKYLQKTGYDARTDLKNAETAKVNLLVGQAVQAMAPLEDESLAPADTVRRRVQDSLRGLSADIDALRWELRKADGFSNRMGDGTKGAMEEAILDNILAGETRARSRLDTLSTAMAPALTRLAVSVQAWEKTHGKNLAIKDRTGKIIEIPEALQKAYGRKSWTADMVIALALNVGNQSNSTRITSFYRDLDSVTVEALLGGQVAARIFADKEAVPAGDMRQGLLSLQDWQDIQSIWDAIGSQWADTQAVHERMFGFKPAGVQATPFVLTDAQGKSITLQGGYYPVRYDPNVSDRVAQWGEQEDILSRSESMFAVPAAKRGHTKAREEFTPELPLRLDTGVLMEHITDAVRFIELAEITRYADKVTQAPAFRHQYTRVYGKKDYEAIRPNLRGLVRQEPPPKMEIARIANAVRKYLVPYGLAWNFKVAALQLTAVFPAMGDIGAQHVMAGIGHIATRGMPAVRAVWEASPYMLSRKDNIDQDLQRNIANFTPSKRPVSVTVAGKECNWEKFVEAGMLPIVAVDTIATTSVWMGAYSKKLSALQGQKVTTAIDSSSEYHEQAVHYADTIVKQSNPDYDSSSRSAFLRAQGMNRLVNMFSSATTLFAQRHKYMYTAHAKGQVSKLQLARFELFDTLIPATAVFMLLALARGMWADDDDDKNTSLFKFFLANTFDFASMRLPVFGSIISDGVMAVAGIDDGLPQRGNLRTALDAPIQLFGTVSGRAGKALHNDINDEQAKRLVYAVGDILSFAARVPASKLVRNAERGYDQWQRDEGTPFSLILPRPGK